MCHWLLSTGGVYARTGRARYSSLSVRKHEYRLLKLHAQLRTTPANLGKAFSVQEYRITPNTLFMFQLMADPFFFTTDGEAWLKALLSQMVLAGRPLQAIQGTLHTC